MANENLVKKLGSETGKERRKRFASNNLSPSELFAMDNNETIRNYLVNLGDSASYNNPYTNEVIEKEVLGEVIQEFQKDPNKLFSPYAVAEELVRQGQKMKSTSLNALKEKDGNENTILIYPLSSDAILMESGNPQLRAQGYKNFINYTKAIVGFLRDPELELSVYKSGQNPIKVKGPFGVLEYNTHIQPGQLGHKHIVISSRTYDKESNTLSNEMGPNDTNFYDALGVYLTKRILESDLITEKQKQDTANNPEGFKIMPSNASVAKSKTNNTVNQVNQAIQQTVKPTPTSEELEKNFQTPETSEYDDDFNPFENDKRVKLEEQDKIKKELEHLKSIQSNDDASPLMEGILKQFGIEQEEESTSKPVDIEDEKSEQDFDSENDTPKKIQDDSVVSELDKIFIANNDSRKQNSEISNEIDSQLKEVIEKAKNLIRIKQLAVSNDALIDLAEKAQRTNVSLINEKEIIEKDNEKLKANVSDLTSKVEVYNINEQGYRTTIDELVKNVRSFENEIDIRDKKLLENSGRIETLVNEVKILTQDKVELEEENKEFQKEISALKVDNSELNKKIIDLNNSISDLNTANTSLTKQKEMLERQLKTAKEDRDSYKRNAEQAEADRTKAIAEKNKAITELSNAQTQHTTQINQLKRDQATALSGKDTEIDALKQQIRELQNSNLDLQTAHKQEINKVTSELDEKHQQEIKKEKENTRSFRDDLSVVMKVFFERAPELMSKEQFEEILKQTKNIDSSKIADHYFNKDNGMKPKN
ncbi:hypothetical protein SS41_23185 [Enterobacter hormaechei subsp. xiangfangensis]|uniref:hypothetical protein n=1 Tax=Enterobacter hormaechei TaxID=158836 RepID=UPI0005F0C450|nr:hypothetical protein [Enterobacter hormaechei]KJN19161.1 hypothetical protein SS41_23185 [Enterobacter hormaechei subsp. xiangfangensis]